MITTNTASSVGGGVYAEGSVLVENNVITDNVDGGGIYCFGGSVEIRNNEIAANKGGSGIYCNNCAAVTIVANAVRNHSPRGGIQSWSSNFTLQTVVIDGNLIEGNASNGDAGGILLHQDHGVAYVSSNVIADNVSARHGGAIWWDTAVEITDNTIVGNAAVLGGGLYVEYATGGRITNNRIVANAATQDGGGLWIKYYQFSLSQNLFARNTAGALGGAIYSLISFPELSNLTFTGNSAASGGAIWFDYNTLRLTSCILWDDHAGTGAEIISPAGIPQISYSDVQGGFAGAGNIDADPRFTDPGGDDYSLATTSPCLDAGDPDARPGGHDVSANARFLDGNLDRVMRVDMGAEEFANVRLAVSGSATPGGTLTLTTTGKPDLFVVLFAGREPGEQLAAPYGALFFSLGAPWNYLPLGAIPGSGSFRVDAQVPTYLPLPFPLVLQEVAAQLVPSAGNVSNAIALTIE
ncbi:MAG: right-handed parallel beta-helix repeat-containing protein [Planctomycetota bacterium]